MRSTFAVEFGLCGWGFEGGLLPTVKVGVVAFWWCRGTITNQVASINLELSRLRVALAEAARELKRSVRNG